MVVTPRDGSTIGRLTSPPRTRPIVPTTAVPNLVLLPQLSKVEGRHTNILTDVRWAKGRERHEHMGLRWAKPDQARLDKASVREKEAAENPW